MKRNPLKFLVCCCLLISVLPCFGFWFGKAAQVSPNLLDEHELIARLEKHVRLLSAFTAQNKDLCDGCMGAIETFLMKLDYTRRFSHELTVLSLKGMLCTRDLDLFLKTWDVFVGVYNVVDPKLFVKEYAQVVFVLYSILGSHVIGSDARASTSQRDALFMAPISCGEIMENLDEYYIRLSGHLKISA